MWIELALAVLLLAAASSAVLVWRLHRQIADLEVAVADAEARGREQAERLTALAQWRDAQEVVEHTAETSVSMVKAVHMGIANIPFSILEAIPPTAVPTRIVRQIHNTISEGVYSALSGLNRAVGRELRKGLGTNATADAPPAAEPVIEASIEPQSESLSDASQAPKALK